MKKKIFKYSIIAILILVLTIISVVLLNKKHVTISSIFGKTQTMLDGSEQAENGENYTYNTSGDDSANYKDGDTSGEKSGWVKDGDTWTYTFYVDDPNAQWYIWEDSETLMEGYTGNYTEGNVGTLFTEETLNEFTPDDSKMASKVDSNGKTVYTWLDSENAYKVTNNGDGIYTKVTTKLSFTITNTQDGVEAPVVEKGSLTINKVVKDSDGNTLTKNDDNTSFQFTIILSAGSADSELIEGTKIFGNVVFKNKVAKVALKAGDSITISDLPAGVSYTIFENSVIGYETSYDSNSGIITKDTESTATFTNTKQQTQSGGNSGESETPDDPNQKYVDITIKKFVTGNNEIEEEHAIEVELNNLKANKTYELSNGTSFKSDSQGSANVSLILSNNQAITLKNIPVGAKYKVFEYAGDYVSSYAITDSNNLGSIANTANRNSKKNVALATATETADEGENITITFTNKKTVTQNLKLSKTVTDENDTNSYMFDIEFGNMEENSSFNSTAGKVIAESNGKAELSVYLAGGEVVVFYDVPVGTTYRVKELASSAIASYTVVDNNGGNKIAKASDSNTKAKNALSTEIETVNQGEDVTITFINNTVNQEPDSVEVSLGVTKSVQNKDGETAENCNDSFDFELTAANSQANGEDYPMPDKTNAKVTGNGTASFGTITFTETGTYTYKVVEKVGDTEKYNYDDSEYIVTYEVTNIDGLLEVTESVKKNGFNSDTIVFTNKMLIDDNNEDDPNKLDENNNSNEDNSNKPDENYDNNGNENSNDSSNEKKNEDKQEESNNTNDNNGKTDEKDDSKAQNLIQNAKTGDMIALYLAIEILASVGLLFIVVKKKK